MPSGGLFGSVKESSVKLLWKFLHCRGKVLFLDRSASVQTGHYDRSSKDRVLDGGRLQNNVSAFVYDDHMPRAFVEPQEYRYDYVYVG